MTQEEFLALIEQSAFLGEDRQKMLKENAAWMTPDERAALAKEVGITEEKIEKDAGMMLEALESFENDINTFTKEELPKLREETESAEKKEESSEAEQLLEDFE